MDVTFNANYHVKVKLTEMGKDILKKRHDELNEVVQRHGGKGLGKFKLNLDEDGYYRDQLWSLMDKFGPYMMTGTQTPFEIDIILLGAEEVENETAHTSETSEESDN